MDKVAEALRFIEEHAPKNAKLRLDSRLIKSGDVFFAVKGTASDGRRYIGVAQDKGASCVIAEAGGQLETDLPILSIENLRESMATIAAAYYNNPSADMISVAVTGTNGKTTSTHWIAELLGACGLNCAVMGTLGCHVGSKKMPIPALTTPDILSLEDVLSELHAQGCKAFAMEASSIGIEQGRIDGLKINIAAFTNLTRDHLDYHKTMENYEAAKTLLFTRRGLETAVINVDDPAGCRIAAVAAKHGCKVIGFSRRRKADLTASNIRYDRDGMIFDLAWQNRKQSISAGFVGLFNVENFLTAVGCALAAGADFDTVCRAAEKLQTPAGRMQRVMKGNDPMVLVDYAHTPDAVEKAVNTLKEIQKHRGGELWVVLGAGGDRDPGKRSLMGQAAALAEHPVLTSDNPRSEDPAEILKAVAQGAPSAVQILNRAEAIRYAVMQAHDNDIVLIAGKGHEDYQEICGVKHHFSDVEEAQKNIKMRKENKR